MTALSCPVDQGRSLELTEEERQALQSLEPKHQLIRDRVRGVVKFYSTGFYLWGEGGTSKSYTVLGELDALDADYVLHNSRMTGRGLVDQLAKAPSSIHVGEDCESIFDDRRAWGVLRSALWSQSADWRPGRERRWQGSRLNRSEGRRSRRRQPRMQRRR